MKGIGGRCVEGGRRADCRPWASRPGFGASDEGPIGANYPMKSKVYIIIDNVSGMCHPTFIDNEDIPHALIISRAQRDLSEYRL